MMRRAAVPAAQQCRTAMRLPRPISACALLLVLAAGCSSLPRSSPGPHGAVIDPDPRLRIQLSDVTLRLAPPPLKASGDFPPPVTRQEIDLAQVTQRKAIFHGHWDGPRYQLLSVMGTLVVIVDVAPWSDGLERIDGCAAKVAAQVEQKLAAERALIERWRREGVNRLPPRTQTERLAVAGREAAWYWSSSDSNSNYYVIPVNGSHYLEVKLESIDNSPMSGRWPAISEHAQSRFLALMHLSGSTTCDAATPKVAEARDAPAPIAPSRPGIGTASQDAAPRQPTE